VIAAGKLDRRVEILSTGALAQANAFQADAFQPHSSTQSASGAISTTWQAVATVWAECLPGPGREGFGPDQRAAYNATRFRIRYRENVTPLNRLRCGGREYDIHGVQEIGRREGLEMLAEARTE